MAGSLLPMPDEDVLPHRVALRTAERRLAEAEARRALCETYSCVLAAPTEAELVALRQAVEEARRHLQLVDAAGPRFPLIEETRYGRAPRPAWERAGLSRSEWEMRETAKMQKRLSRGETKRATDRRYYARKRQNQRSGG